MKKLAWLLIFPLAAILFAGCQNRLTPSVYEPSDFNTMGAIALTVEGGQHDKSLETYTYYVTNYTDEAITYTPEYIIEVKKDDVWYSLPPSQEYLTSGGENDREIVIEPGESLSGQFSFWAYDYTVEDGTYRLIKEIGGETYQAEFLIGTEVEESMTPDTPLENLPREFSLSDITCDLALDHDGTMIGGSMADVLAFLEHAEKGSSDTLRVVTYEEENRPTLMDVIIEPTGYLLRIDNTRRGEERIYEIRLAYLVTDGEAVSLSNLADLSYGEGDRILLSETVPILEKATFSEWDTIIDLVSEMTRVRLAKDATMARYLSPDGDYWVNLTKNPMDYTVTSKSYGMSRTLTQLNDYTEHPEELQIISATWLAEKTVQLLCKEGGETGNTYTAVFDMEMGNIISISE